MSNLKHNRSHSIITFTVSLVLIVVAGWVFLNRQYIADQIKVWQYSPSTAVAAISGKVAYTPKGEFIFYATMPEVSDQEKFNSQCPRRETASPILGCYTSEDRIFIYDIVNKDLDGIKEVTAAHEMLHAAWLRMSDADREKIGALLQSAYDELQYGALKQRMAYYQRTEPTEFLNELHSILGTEVKQLSPELERHYKDFFVDRQVVVAMYNQYSATFSSLYDRIEKAKSELTELSDKITKALEVYRANEVQLSKDISSLNARASSGDFTSIAQFRSERAALVNRSNQLDAERAAVNQLMVTYNALAEEYNTLVQKIDGLNQSIDSYKAIEKAPSV